MKDRNVSKELFSKIMAPLKEIEKPVLSDKESIYGFIASGDLPLHRTISNLVLISVSVLRLLTPIFYFYLIKCRQDQEKYTLST
ncbi:hypothetical protein [Paucilactobacillus hokkaidonensis]|uniref:hypothetical protein n=1 Tax=Paucilactobacillus hokkaidonensis TaxID=1193095 RepID=UPI0020934F2F|nr:hypothetical protein [Paucilactobacillus hokkaidonensis]